jgi:FSR family fosmidomycin resistance protein-like MFS transporter
VDLCQGAIPALLPFLAAERGWSFAALGALVLAATVASSLVQPLFGLLSDRAAQAWLLPAGVLLAGAGVAAVGLAPSFPAAVAAALVSGLGVAAFHPEGARFANLASGARRGRGMSLFSVGGNLGFALGPVVTTPLVLLFGLEGTLGLLVAPLVAAVVLTRDLGRLRALRAAAPADRARSAGARDAWGPFARLGVIVALRSGVYFGLQTFIAVWFVRELGSSVQAGNAALTAMLVAGAAGTLVGGELADRVGARAVLVGSLAALLPLLALVPLASSALATPLLALVGFVTIASFSVTVVLGQAYLPTRLGLASGVTLGLAIGTGGVVAAALGLVADRHGLEAVLWIIALLPAPALLLAWTLPTGERATLRMRALPSRSAG